MAHSPFRSIGAIKAFRRHDNSFEFHCEHGRVRITVLSDRSVRIRATQASEFGPAFSYAIAKIHWPKLKTTVRTGKAITIQTKRLVATCPRWLDNLVES